MKVVKIEIGDTYQNHTKVLELIKNKEMILHVYEAAQKTNTGDVYVATPDQKIIDLINIFLYFIYSS